MLFNYEDNFSGFVGDLDSEVASWGFACDGWPKSERVVHLFSHLATNSSPQTLPRIYDIHQRPLSPVSKGTVIALRTTSPRRRPPPSLTVVCRAVRRREGRLNHQKGLRYGPTPHHSSPYFAPLIFASAVRLTLPRLGLQTGPRTCSAFSVANVKDWSFGVTSR